MIGKIIKIENNTIFINLSIDINQQPNLVGLHLVCEEADTRIVAEIVNVDEYQMMANIVGEIMG